MATFGEMTALANEHLTDLRNQLHLARLERDIRSRTAVPELARLAHVLARYHNEIADGFGVPDPTGAGVRVGARRASNLIKQAEHLLGPGPPQTKTVHAVPPRMERRPASGEGDVERILIRPQARA